MRLSPEAARALSSEIVKALDQVVSVCCKSLRLHTPQLLVTPDPALPEGEYEVAVAGVTRFSGSLSSSFLDWWGEHPTAGRRGRSGLTGAPEGDSTYWAPTDQIARAVEEVLWDDPGLLLAAPGVLAEAPASSELPAHQGISADWPPVARELARRRIPLPDHASREPAPIDLAGAASRVNGIEELASRLHPSTIRIRLGVEFDEEVSYKDKDSPVSVHLLPKMTSDLFYELGIAYPEVKFERAEDLAPWAYQILISSLPRGTGTIPPGKVLVDIPPDAGTQSTEPWIHPVDGHLCSWIPRDLAEGLGSSTWNPTEFLLLHMAACLKEAAPEFADLSWTEQQLNRLAEIFPDLTAAARSAYGDARLAVVLRRLVAEGFSIRDLFRVLERLLEFNELTNSALVLDTPETPQEEDWSIEDPVALTEYVRGGMKDYVSYTQTQGANTLRVFLLDPGHLEPSLRDAVRGADPYEPVYGFREAGAFLRALRTELTGFQSLKLPAPALLTTSALRPHVRRLIAAQFPKVAVVSYQELAYTLNILPLSRISI